MSWRQRFEALVGIDVRSLAALRIGLSATLIWDLLARLRDLEAHYTDAGVLPRADLLKWKGDHPFFSLHLMSGQIWVQALLFGLALGAAVAMLIGWRTRAATIASWILLASLHGRHPLILHGGDQLLRVLLFWAMFVPWGRAASVDGQHAGGTAAWAQKPQVVSVATLALKLQLCGMYWFSAALKWHPIWIEDGAAVGMAMRLDQLVTPFGRYLTNFPEMMKWATHGTMVLETVGVALAFAPIFTAPLQLVAVLLFVGFHLFGLAPALYLGIFPWVCAAAWLMFLPDRFWDAWCPERLRRLGRRWQSGMVALASRLPAVARPTGRQPGAWRWLGQQVVQVALVVLIIYVTLWNLRTVDFDRWEQVLPIEANTLGRSIQMGQIWNLFAPYPATEDGWFVFVGTLVSGEQLDIRTLAEPNFDKPKNVSLSLGPSRWRKYLMNLDDRQNAIHRRYYGAYLCRHWNARHQGDERLASIRMFVVRERTLKSGEEEAPRRGQLWNQVCVLRDAS